MWVQERLVSKQVILLTELSSKRMSKSHSLRRERRGEGDVTQRGNSRNKAMLQNHDCLELSMFGFTKF